MDSHESTLRCFCFRCLDGHIHLKWDNTLFTFTENEFSLLATMVKAMQSRLNTERDEKALLISENGVSLNPFMM